MKALNIVVAYILFVSFISLSQMYKAKKSPL